MKISMSNVRKYNPSLKKTRSRGQNETISIVDNRPSTLHQRQLQKTMDAQSTLLPDSKKTSGLPFELSSPPLFQRAKTGKDTEGDKEKLGRVYDLLVWKP
ncbi:MAG: hypothetical protein AAGA66_15270 [Bacteroidota bacterium]